MLRYIGSRLLQSVFIVVSITLGVFVILRVTAGDPARVRAPVFRFKPLVQLIIRNVGN